MELRSRSAKAKISIHALREEGDLDQTIDQQAEIISIHALREEGDPLTSRPKSTPI